MIKIENTDVYGFETAIRGMRNPMNSHDKSDSGICTGGHATQCDNVSSCHYVSYTDVCRFCIGDNDFEFMKELISAGTDHSKFMRMINVTCDITAPLYWWKEFDTYKVGTVRNSCSTMHKIHEKEFTLDDFSHEHLTAKRLIPSKPYSTEGMMETIISDLNCFRALYLITKDKEYWWQLIQLLPSSYNQRATIQMNYAVLRNMYHARNNHKLDEWHDFCKWTEELPYSELITGGFENDA